MSIPASRIVSINPRTISAGSSDLEMNGLVLTSNKYISALKMVEGFSSVKTVGAFFGEKSKEYDIAQCYFRGFIKKFASPRKLFFGRHITESVAAWLQGGPLTATVVDIAKVTDGAMVISVDNAYVAITGLDFSKAKTFSDIAAAINAKLTGATCEFDSLKHAFILTTESTGESACISYAETPTTSTDVSGILRLSNVSGAVISPGRDLMTIGENITAIQNTTQNWVTFTTLTELSASETLPLAEWANNNWGYLYVAHTTNANTPIGALDNDPVSAIKQAKYDNTAAVFGSIEYATLIMSIAACIAWLRVNGAITFAFKSQSGLVATVTSEAYADALIEKSCNFYGKYATRNADFDFLYPGCLVSSEYGYIDPLINAIWLNNRLQVSIMDGMKSIGRLPYTERGYTMIRSWMMAAINDALKNGVIEPGVSLSDLQISELFNEAGKDISEELMTNGYFIQVEDAGASVRTNRGSPNVSLWYTYGGSIQKIEVASTAVF